MYIKIYKLYTQKVIVDSFQTYLQNAIFKPKQNIFLNRRTKSFQGNTTKANFSDDKRKVIKRPCLN